MSLAVHSILLVAMFLLAAFFAATETAIFSLTKMQRKRIEGRKHFFSKWVIEHLDHPGKTLTTILIGNLVVHTLAAAIMAVVALEVAGAENLGLIMTIFTLALVFFAEILPKTLAVRKNESFSLFVALPLRLFVVILTPFRFFIRFFSDMVLRLASKGKKDHAEAMSEEELKTLVKIGEEEGVLDSQERRMIQKLFELGERSVRDIMTPRTDLVGLDTEAQRAQHIETIRRYHFSQMPVYQGSLDNILGILPVQEYMLNPDAEIQSLLIPPPFVPESKRIDDLLTEFREKNKSYAVCVDEFGGTAGIVTLEDILEEIFGEFYDEYARVENPIRAAGHQEFIVEAKIALADFNEHFGTKLQAEDASTLGGYILEKLGEVPEKGKVLEAEGLMIRIHDVIRQRRIKTVVVRKPA